MCPSDRMVDEEEFARDDKDVAQATLGVKRRFDEFDCPECDAYNPWEDGFGDGDEIRCSYCGVELAVRVTDEGKLRLAVA